MYPDFKGTLINPLIYQARWIVRNKETFFLLLEFSLGPFWVWIFLNETISQETFYGGIIVIVSVVVYSFLEIKNTKIKAVSTG